MALLKAGDLDVVTLVAVLLQPDGVVGHEWDPLHLAAQAGVEPGVPFGYLVAPPVESVLGVDAALKAADVTLLKFFGPPTETNFGGAWITGALDAVEASARAFEAAVCDVAAHPSLR